MRRFFWIAGALAAAGIVHILAVLAIPQLAEHDAWKRLSALLKPNTLAFADAKNAPHLPFTPPDLITAYCLFDISEHNVIVEAPLPEAPWSVAVTARSGENFYVITGADAKKPVVRLLIIPHDRLPEEFQHRRNRRRWQPKHYRLAKPNRHCRDPRAHSWRKLSGAGAAGASQGAL